MIMLKAQKILVGVLAFFGVVFVLTEISAVLFNKGFWSYLSYVIPF